MLFRDYMRARLGLTRYGAEHAVAHSLLLIEHFSFGLTYTIHLKSGASVDINDPEAILGIIEAEFMEAETFTPVLVLTPDLKRLHVRPKNEMGRTWGKNMPKTINQLRLALVEYNMTDKWPKGIPREQSPFERFNQQRW